VYIYCDESGSFAKANESGAWCVVVCYVLTESQRRAAESALSRYKLAAGKRVDEEVKRKSANDRCYFQLLDELANVGGLAVAIATDSGSNHGAHAKKALQIQQLHRSKDGADELQRHEIDDLVRDMSGLSTQLYVEYICRLELAWRTIRSTVTFFAKSFPATFSRFQWIFDEKPENLKRLFCTSIPGFIKELGKREPLELLEKGDYSRLARFLVPESVRQASLLEGVPLPEKRIYDAARMMTNQVAFVDSRTSFGVQIADVIANGLRACLRGEFEDNDCASRLLGRLLYEKEWVPQVIPLIHFTDSLDAQPNPVAHRAVSIMGRSAQRLSRR
jgi:Protein of unknown function (DUF3800)